MFSFHFNDNYFSNTKMGDSTQTYHQGDSAWPSLHGQTQTVLMMVIARRKTAAWVVLVASFRVVNSQRDSSTESLQQSLDDINTSTVGETWHCDLRELFLWCSEVTWVTTSRQELSLDNLQISAACRSAQHQQHVRSDLSSAALSELHINHNTSCHTSNMSIATFHRQLWTSYISTTTLRVTPATCP